jgi:hypothetical protein
LEIGVAAASSREPISTAMLGLVAGALSISNGEYVLWIKQWKKQTIEREKRIKGYAKQELQRWRVYEKELAKSRALMV